MSSFWDLLWLYRWSLPASILMAAVLALIGAQWTARRKSAQIFVLGQGSSLGIVLGLAVNFLWGMDSHSLSLILGLSLGGLTLLASEYLIESRSDRNHIYLTLFVVFLALSHLLTALVPSLESHLAASYFGDLAVMSDSGAIASLIVALLWSGFIYAYWRPLTRSSFQLVNHSLIHKTWTNRAFDLGTLLITTLSIQHMGYLFTVGSLFVATTFATRNSHGLTSYTRRLQIIASVGTALGFICSLLSTSLPTVPCVLLSQLFVGVVIYIKK